MLVVSRRAGECIRVGDDVTITLISMASGQARIGIEAPLHVGVHREEIYLEIASENMQSAEAGPELIGLIREAAGEAVE